MEYIEQYEAKGRDEIVSSCRIDSPFDVKLDFCENYINFSNTSTSLLLLRFCDPGRNFIPKSERLHILTILKVSEDIDSAVSPTSLK